MKTPITWVRTNDGTRENPHTSGVALLVVLSFAIVVKLVASDLIIDTFLTDAKPSRGFRPVTIATY